MDFDKAFDFENGFYLTANAQRLAKALAQFELFRESASIPGEIAEFGVFKGASLMRWIRGRSFWCPDKEIFAFDTFETFPTKYDEKDEQRLKVFTELAGNRSITVDELRAVLEYHRETNVKLISGDVVDTAKSFFEERPEVRLSFVNLDTDTYEPARAILAAIEPHLSKNAVVLVDNYGVFEGETRAVDEFLKDKAIYIERLQYCRTPYFRIW